MYSFVLKLKSANYSCPTCKFKVPMYSSAVRFSPRSNTAFYYHVKCAPPAAEAALKNNIYYFAYVAGGFDQLSVLREIEPSPSRNKWEKPCLVCNSMVPLGAYIVHWDNFGVAHSKCYADITKKSKVAPNKKEENMQGQIKWDIHKPFDEDVVSIEEMIDRKRKIESAQLAKSSDTTIIESKETAMDFCEEEKTYYVGPTPFSESDMLELINKHGYTRDQFTEESK